MQHTVTHCNALQHTATHCNTPQHTATHCHTLQHAATHCNSDVLYPSYIIRYVFHLDIFYLSVYSEHIGMYTPTILVGPWKYIIRYAFHLDILLPHIQRGVMEWIRLVGSSKLQVSFAEYPLCYRALLQKRPVILRSLLIKATPYQLNRAPTHPRTKNEPDTYGLALVSRIDKIIGLFCKRALSKRLYFAKETSNLIHPTNRNRPIVSCLIFHIWLFSLCMTDKVRAILNS